MRYKVHHRTSYGYSEPVSLSHNLAHLRPLSDERQKLRSFSLRIHPEPREVSGHMDVFGNHVHFVQVQEGHREFVVDCESELEVLAPRWPEAFATTAWETVATRIGHRPSGEDALVAGFRHASPFAPILEPCRELALASFIPERPILEAALDLTRRIPKDFQYSPHATAVTTPVAEVLRTRRGVCQDFAHLMLCCLRALGLPARYVSGYLETSPPPGKARLVGADASHAWVQLWVPGFGWVDLDPTNGLAPRERHIRLAVGRDFGDVSPLKGLLLGGGTQAVQVSVDVVPLIEGDESAA